jgi:VWFA-related protein
MHRSILFKGLLWAGLGAAGLYFPCQAQTPSSTSAQANEAIRTTTNLVQTDVSVFDREGRFAEGLKREDFELRVNGTPRSILVFERVKAGSPDEEAQIRAARGGNSPAVGSGTSIPLDRGRTIIFYLDDYHMSPASVQRVKEALQHFVEHGIRQNDQAAVFSASGQLEFLQQLTNEKAVLRAAINKFSYRNFSSPDTGRAPMSESEAIAITREDRRVLDYFVDQFTRDSEPLRRTNPNSPVSPSPATARSRSQAEASVKLRARQIVDQIGNLSASSLLGLENLIRSASQLDWRKVVFLISDGFPLNLGYQTLDLRRVTDAAARSGVVICSIDSGGLIGGNVDSSRKTAFDVTGRLAGIEAGSLDGRQKVLHDLASGSGGTATLNSNALPTTINEILTQTADYYLIAWRPDDGDLKQGQPQRLQVQVITRPDLNIRLRSGFSVETSQPVTKAKSVSKKEKVDPLTRALHSAFPLSELPVALAVGFTSSPEKNLSIVATLEVPRTELGLKEGSESELEVLGVAVNNQGKTEAGFEQNLTITASAQKVIYNHELAVQPGLYQIRVAVRDKSGRIGSASQWIELPIVKSGNLVLSSVFVGNFDESDSLRISGSRHFLPNAKLGLLGYVYNPQVTGAPDLGLQIQIMRDDQPVLTKPTIRLDTSGISDLSRIPFAQDLDLRGLPAGQYVLQVTAIDRLSKKTASQVTRFTIY